MVVVGMPWQGNEGVISLTTVDERKGCWSRIFRCLCLCVCLVIQRGEGKC